MPSIWFREKYPGEWVAIVDESGWSAPGRAILEGMTSHIEDCFGTVFGFYGIHPSDLLALDGLIARVSEKFKEGVDLVRIVPDNGTTDDSLATLTDMLDLAHWWLAFALDALAAEQISDALKFHALSVANLARFETSLNWIESLADGGGSGSGFDPVANGKKGAAVRHAPRNELMKYALERYSAKSWLSMRDASKKILSDVVNKGKEIGCVLADGNAERTVYDWIRNSPRTVTAGG